MMRCTTVVILTFVLLAGTAYAASTTQKDKCLQNVLVIAEIQESEDTPRIGEMAQQEVDDLVEVATHLCQQGNFQYAEKLLEIVRGMLASE